MSVNLNISKQKVQCVRWRSSCSQKHPPSPDCSLSSDLEITYQMDHSASSGSLTEVTGHRKHISTQASSGSGLCPLCGFQQDETRTLRLFSHSSRVFIWNRRCLLFKALQDFHPTTTPRSDLWPRRLLEQLHFRGLLHSEFVTGENLELQFWNAAPPDWWSVRSAERIWRTVSKRYSCSKLFF